MERRAERSDSIAQGAIVDAAASLALWLRAGRVQRGMSVDDVARVTKIQPRILERLEAGKLDGLPAEVFVRGFIRSVARCIGLDEREALQRYAACGGGAMLALGSTEIAPAARALVEAMSDLAPRSASAARATPRKMLAVDDLEPSDAAAGHVEFATGSLVNARLPEIDTPPAIAVAVDLNGPDGPDGPHGLVAVEPPIEAAAPEAAARVDAAAVEASSIAAPANAAPANAAPANAAPANAAPANAAPSIAAPSNAAPSNAAPSIAAPSNAAPAIAAPGAIVPSSAVPPSSAVAQMIAPSQSSQSPQPSKKKKGRRAKGRNKRKALAMGTPAGASPVVPAPASSDAPWTPRMPAFGSAPWRKPAYAAGSTIVPRLVIDDADPDSAELALEERAERQAPRRSLLPPILLDREDRSARQGGLTLAVIILLIAATLTLSYLMRRPSASGDGMTLRSPAVGDPHGLVVC